MTLEELDQLGGELFTLIDKASKGDDPRFREEGQIIRTAIMLAVEFVADHKRIVKQQEKIVHHLEFLNKGLCALVDLQAAGYQDGILVKIANEIKIETEDFKDALKGGIEESLNKGFEAGANQEEIDHYTQEAVEAVKAFDKAIEEAETDGSTGHGDNRTD